MEKTSEVIALGLHGLFTSPSFSWEYIGSQSQLDSPVLKELEANWNQDDCYTFNYRIQKPEKDIIFVKILPLDDTLILNIMRSKDSKGGVKTLDLSTKDFIDETSKKMKNVDKLESQIKNLLDMSSSETPQNKNTTSSSSSTRPQFQRGDDSNPDYYPNRNMYRNPHQEINPYSIGSSDLDPFGQGGNGMFAGPGHPMFGQNSNPNSGRYPPNSYIPPGARYDPIQGGPNSGNNPFRNPNSRNPRPTFFGEPDNDELPPPGFGGYGDIM